MNRVINPTPLGGGGGGLVPTIRATAPVGSTVTCDGQTKVVGAEGYVDFVVDIGTYTVTATKDGKTATEEVKVDEIGLFNVEIHPERTYLYKFGNEYTDITGGYSISSRQSSSATLTKNIDNMALYTPTNYALYVGSSIKIPTSGFNTVHILAKYTKANSSDSYYCNFSLDDSRGSTGTWSTYGNYQRASFDTQEIVFDVATTKDRYVGLYSNDGVLNIYAIWLE